MNQPLSSRHVLALILLLPGAAALAAVPLAHCRQGDKTESGLQG